MKFTLKTRPKYPTRNKKVLVTSLASEESCVFIGVPVYTAAEVLEFCTQAGIPPEEVFVEIETNTLYGYEEYDLYLYGYREETDDEFNERVKQYVIALAKYNTWAKSHKAEIKAEKERRNAAKLEAKHAQVDKLKREAAVLQAKLDALEKT